MSKVDELIQKINKDKKEELLTKGLLRESGARIPFSSPRANYMYYGGIPRGRLTEFCGKESSGKTSSALDIVKNAQPLFLNEWDERITELTSKSKLLKDETLELEALQQRGPLKIMYVDMENTLDRMWARTLGVDTESMYIFSSGASSAEELLEHLLDIIRTGEMGLIILDSLPQFIPECVLTASVEKDTYGGNAKAITKFVNKAVPLCGRYNTTIIGINHVKPVLNSVFPQEYRPGGKAWQYLISVCIKFNRGKYVDVLGVEIEKSNAHPAGNKVEMQNLKNKICRPDRQLGFYTLNYDKGVDILPDIVDVAFECKLIVREGSYYDIIMNNEKLCRQHGSTNLYEFIKNNPEVFDYLYKETSAWVVRR